MRPRRRSSRVSLAAACWLLARAAVSSGQPIQLFAEGEYWRAYPSGTITITEGGRPGSGTRIDLSDDLDVGAADVGGGRFGAEIGRHRLSVSYEPLSASGDATLRSSIVFHGIEYPAGERVRSDVGLRSIVPRYDYTLLDSAAATLRAGLAAYVWTFDAEMRGSSGDASRSFTHVLPLVPLEGDLSFGRWSVGTGVSFGMLASDRYVVEVDPGISATLVPGCRVRLGYRWRDFAFHETTNRGHLEMHGPVVSLWLGFSAFGEPP